MVFFEEEFQLSINSMRQEYNVAIERLNLYLGCNDRNIESRTTSMKFLILILAGQTPSRISTSSGYITRQMEDIHRREKRLRHFLKTLLKEWLKYVRCLSRERKTGEIKIL